MFELQKVHLRRSYWIYLLPKFDSGRSPNSSKWVVQN